MAKVRCKICGAVFEEGAETCPVCGVPKDLFESAPEEVKEEPKEEVKELIAESQAGKVRCKICGAVFEEGAETCPVCGVPKDFFEPLAEEVKEEATFDEAMSIIIIGGGIAAVTAAEKAREQNKKASITIISAEEELPYNRPMLTKNFAAAQDENPFPIYDRDFYIKNNIELIRGKKADRIDHAAKLLYCGDDAPYYFDKLIFATGAYCFVPPFKGADKPNVIAIRSVADARGIAAILDEVKDIAVIGGGVLGLEAAWAMCGLGKKVTVLETADKLFAGKISAETSAKLQSVIEAKGIEVEVNANTTEIYGEGKAEGVELADGRKIPAQLVLISCGVRAETALAETIGVQCNRGIVVDEYMRTNLADVYACGDCANFEGINFALWEEAMKQAAVAGYNAAGADKKYVQLNPAIIMHAFGTGMLVFGATEKESEQVITAESNAYKTYYVKNNAVAGITSLGDIVDMSELMELVNSAAAPSAIK